MEFKSGKYVNQGKKRMLDVGIRYLQNGFKEWEQYIS